MERLFAGLILLLAAYGPNALAQSNLVLLVSACGDYVGAGQGYYSTNQSDISITGSPTTVSVAALGFTMVFDAPGEDNLTVGQYSNAVQYPSNGAAPGLSVSGNGRACTNLCGNFQLLELATNSVGQVVSLWATFLQHCGCGNTPPLTGEIRYHSQLAVGGPLARTLLVPADFPTIQSAVNDVSPLAVDTVLVGPGLYVESVQLGSNSVHLVSAAGPSATFIMAPGTPAVVCGVDYQNGISDMLLCGFTLTNSAEGVHVAGGFSPTIVSNLIVNCGTGIDCNASGLNPRASAVIVSNIVTGCSGLAAEFFSTTDPLVQGNRLEGNGGGIYLGSAGTPSIYNNIISFNRGDGVNMANQYAVNIVQNLVMGNSGTGLGLQKPQGGMRGPWGQSITQSWIMAGRESSPVHLP